MPARVLLRGRPGSCGSGWAAGSGVPDRDVGSCGLEWIQVCDKLQCMPRGVLLPYTDVAGSVPQRDDVGGVELEPAAVHVPGRVRVQVHQGDQRGGESDDVFVPI